jgi:hypothetical protein
MISSMGFGSAIQLRRGMVLPAVLTLLMSASPTAQAEAHEPSERQRAHNLDRLQALMEPLARELLGSSDTEDLEANIETQLLSGLFGDILAQSLVTLTHTHPKASREPPDDVRAEFLDSVEALGAKRSKVARALELSLFSNRITALCAMGTDLSEDAEAPPFEVDLADFLYDTEIPREIRRAARAEWQSSLCMIAIAYALEHKQSVDEWLLEELVDRWLSGQRESLPLLWALASEQEVLPDDLLVEFDRLVEHGDMVPPPDLNALFERARAFSAALETIAEHASRQPDGVWPPD